MSRAEAHAEQQLAAVWHSPTGFPGFLSVVNNRPLGMRFMVTAFVFFLVGGILALLMRIQLTVAENTFLSPETYNQLFTMHGSTMMFLFAVPFLEGLAMYVLPIMLGSRDLAFPRLSAFGYWTYLFGGLVFYASFLVGEVPDAGWFAYTPLSSSKYSGLGLDFWTLGLSLVEISGIVAAVEIVVTIFKSRAPGMSLGRMPMFGWAMLAAGLMSLFAFTTLLVASLMLELDRAAGTQFFNPDRGGTSLLWQHLFWFFGHPEVYIIFLPATGIVSMVVATFARRLLGYGLIAVAILVTGFVSFGLWVHHMYTTGLPELSMNFFAAASLMIAVASGTQIFAWIASLWGQRPPLKTPLMFVLGFMVIFVMGGMTGVMIAIVPFDWQVHDTYFIVAHFHYVLIGGAVFPMMAGLYYWVPKFTGRMLNALLGQLAFWATFIGFHLTFFPMHIMGLFGMPRRIYTYPEVLELEGHNLVATVGAFLLGAGFLVFLVDLLLSRWWGSPAGNSPWGGDTLEWSLPSPVPPYVFYQPPVVRSRHPQWDEQPVGSEGEAAERASAALRGQPAQWRATLTTDAVTARPQAIQPLPGPSYQPLFVSLGLVVALLAVLTKVYLVGLVGTAVAIASLASWLWPDQRRLQMLRSSDIGREAGLPILVTGGRSTAWCGMICLIAILGTALGALVYSYFYIRLYSEQWPQDDLPLPELPWAAIAYGLLLLTAPAMYWAKRSFLNGQSRGIQASLSLVLLLAAGFLSVSAYALARDEMALGHNAYTSLFYLLTAFPWLLAVTGMALVGAAQGRAWSEYRDLHGYMHLQMQLTALFWYFTIIAGAVVFAVLYVSPHLL